MLAVAPPWHPRAARTLITQSNAETAAVAPFHSRAARPQAVAPWVTPTMAPSAVTASAPAAASPTAAEPSGAQGREGWRDGRTDSRGGASRRHVSDAQQAAAALHSRPPGGRRGARNEPPCRAAQQRLGRRRTTTQATVRALPHPEPTVADRWRVSPSTSNDKLPAVCSSPPIPPNPFFSPIPLLHAAPIHRSTGVTSTIVSPAATCWRISMLGCTPPSPTASA